MRQEFVRTIFHTVLLVFHDSSNKGIQMPRKLVRSAAVVLIGLAAMSGACSNEPRTFIGILTGGTSGVYYPLGVALSKIYGKHIANARVQVQSTKASVENLKLLQKRRGEIAFALGDTVKLAWEGNAEAGFPRKLDKLRGIAAIYPNFIQIVASQESGVATLSDLKGKRISVGAPKSGTELNARAIFGQVGMRYEDFGKTEYLPFSESVELIKNRQLDATLQSAGLGVASIRDLATSIPITLVGIQGDVAKNLGPPYAHADIPAGTYKGQSAAVSTVTIRNLLVTHSRVSDDVAYQMTQLLFENLPALVAAHKAASGIKLQNASQDMPIPLHPGAARYYKEKGLP